MILNTSEEAEKFNEVNLNISASHTEEASGLNTIQNHILVVFGSCLVLIYFFFSKKNKNYKPDKKEPLIEKKPQVDKVE